MAKQVYDWYFKEFPCESDLPVATFPENNWFIRNTEIPFLHFHDTLEITFWVEGEGCFLINGKEYPMKAGDFCVICPNTMHQSFNRGTTISRCQYLYIDLDRFIRMDHREFQNLEYLKYHAPQFRNVIPSGECGTLAALLQAIFQETAEKSINYHSSVMALTGLLLNRILRYQEPMTTQNANARTGTFSLAPALEHINIHYAENMTTGELAALCYMSVTSFRRIFQQVMQLSPMEYLNQVRVRKACEKLVSTSMSILDISEAVGFNSVSSFCRNFHDMMQMSPRAWRKKARGPG